jgi:ribose-phosphate pyrophosphokinase
MKYERIKYPDGQISAKITDLKNPEIFERINSYEDLMFVVLLAEAVKHHCGRNICSLFIPCLFGQRSDRRFDMLQSYDLKIIAEIINSCNFRKVAILDLHSDVALALINNSSKISSREYVSKSLYELDKVHGSDVNDIVLVSPDAGAYKKVFEYGQEFNLPVVAAVKHRNKDGVVDLRFIGDVRGKECLIVDDLLDGGYTFHLLGEQLKAQGASRVYLYVTHAYFNKGIDFTPHIDHFFCTNSVKDITDPKVTQYKVI